MSTGHRVPRNDVELAVGLLSEQLGGIQTQIAEVRGDTRSTREDIADIRERLARLEAHTPKPKKGLVVNIKTGVIGLGAAGIGVLARHLLK